MSRSGFRAAWNIIKISGLIWVQTVQWCYHKWWFMIKETDSFKTDHGYSIRSRASCQWPGRMKTYITYEKLSNSKYITALSAVCRNIIFNNERIIWGKHFASYRSLFRNSLFRTYLKIRLSKFRGNSGCLVTQSVSTDRENLILWLGVTINIRLNL